MLLCFIATAQDSVTFVYTGFPQEWVVPSCVTNLTVTCVGAGGGGNNGGAGATVFGNISVVAGQTLYIYVGGQGDNFVGGYNGGGNPAIANDIDDYSHGGGGASDIRTSQDINDRIIVAAGGGGTGGGNTDAFGGNGGCPTGGLGESPFGDGGEGAGLDYSGGGDLLGMLMEILVIMACSGWVEMVLVTHVIT